ARNGRRSCWSLGHRSTAAAVDSTSALKEGFGPRFHPRRTLAMQRRRGEDVGDIRTRRRLGEPLTYRQGWVWQTRFSHDGRWLATASGGEAAQLWDAHCPTNQPVQRFPHGHGVLSVCFSPDDTRVLTASEDGT